MFNVFFSNQNPWDLSLDHGRTCLERNLLFTRGPDTDVVNTVAFIVMTLGVRGRAAVGLYPFYEINKCYNRVPGSASS